jgi:hypothetical protein
MCGRYYSQSRGLPLFLLQHKSKYNLVYFLQLILGYCVCLLIRLCIFFYHFLFLFKIYRMKQEPKFIVLLHINFHRRQIRSELFRQPVSSLCLSFRFFLLLFVIFSRFLNLLLRTEVRTFLQNFKISRD